MLRRFLAATAGVLVLAVAATAFEAVGTLRKVDADKGLLDVHAGGQDRSVKIAKDVKVLDKDGKALPDGLRSKELKEGTVVTLTVEPEDRVPVIKQIRLGGDGDPRRVTGKPPAFEAVGTIQKVDADKGILRVQGGGGQEHTVKVAESARILDKDGKALPDGLRSKELKEGTVVTVTVQPEDGTPVIKQIRLGGKTGERPGDPDPRRVTGKTSVGLKPLTEMTAEDRYKGEDGGLYGAGKNEPPEAHRAAARAETAKIQPLGPGGKPSADGKIVLISISMSNATVEFSAFKRLADADREKSPKVTVVDCAQGGQAMAQWAPPGAPAWKEAEHRLEQAGVTPRQVQVAWIKLANPGPRGDLSEHGKRLKDDTLAVLHNARARFPNLRIAYLGSRIYAGYANGPLNPEPYAYESAYVVRWLIQDQVKGDETLNFDPKRGEVRAPLLLWGPYFWADGLTPRKGDELVWKREDLGDDGTHPSESGRRKVAEMLLKFFKTDAEAKTWFVRNRD